MERDKERPASVSISSPTRLNGIVCAHFRRGRRKAVQSYHSARPELEIFRSMQVIIRAEVIEHDAMLDEVAEWRQRNEAEAAEERARAILGPKSLFTKDRRVIVERRRAR